MEVESTSRYEVRCPRCDVTFPLETRVCVHCGGRTTSGARRMLGRPSSWQTPEMTHGEHEVSILEDMEGHTAVGPFSPDADEEVEPPRAGFLRTAITVMWVLLAIGFSIMRACSEGG